MRAGSELVFAYNMCVFLAFLFVTSYWQIILLPLPRSLPVFRNKQIHLPLIFPPLFT